MGRRKSKSLATQDKAMSSVSAWSEKQELWFQMYDGNVSRSATSSPVEAAVSLIANDISTLDVSVYEELTDGTYREATTLSAYRVLKKPNNFQTITDLLNKMVRDVYYYGNGYLYADRNNRNEIVALYNVDPKRVVPYVSENGDVYYGVGLTQLEAGTGYDSSPIMVPASEVFHHRVFYRSHPLKGISPLYAIGGSAQMNAAISENMANFHANNARPGGILTIAGGLKQDARDRLRREFTQNFGQSNTGKTAILDFDAKWQSMSYSAQESSVVELLKYSVEDVCRALRVPLHMMGVQSAMSTTSVEVSMRQYYSHCLRPAIEALENRFNDFFEFTGTQWEIEFDIDNLFRAETLTRVEAMSKGIQGGIYTVNEARATEHLPPIEGGDGAFLQRQMTPVALLSELAAAELSRNTAPAPAPQNLSAKDVTDAILKSLDVQPSSTNYADLILKEMAAL